MEKVEHSDKFYHSIALQQIKDDDYYYKTVHKCGIYEGKRVYEPILKDEYRMDPPILGLPLVILVDDEGNAEYIRDLIAIDILREAKRNMKFQPKRFHRVY